MAGKFVISKRSNGEFQFNLKAGNGQVILSSEGYKDRGGCTNGIESVKKNAGIDARYDRKTAANSKLYSTLKTRNNQVIGSSQMYADEAGRDNGIASVKTNAPDAAVEDETA